MQIAVIVLAGAVSLCVILIAILWAKLMETAAKCCEAEASELRLKKENRELRDQMQKTIKAINEVDAKLFSKAA